MTREAFEQLRGKSVEFLVRNIYLPDPVTVLSELHGEEMLTGTVIDLSDDARNEEAAFLVVQVKHLQCIVAAEHAKPPVDAVKPPVDGGES